MNCLPCLVLLSLNAVIKNFFKDRDRSRTCMYLGCNQIPGHSGTRPFQFFNAPWSSLRRERLKSGIFCDTSSTVTGSAGLEPAHCGFRGRRFYRQKLRAIECGRQDSNLLIRRGGAALGHLSFYHVCFVGCHWWLAHQCPGRYCISGYRIRGAGIEPASADSQSAGLTV